ncbi:hypothetical protein LOTGIDRAFT_141832 [Lottia gigantea]|uniref:ABC transporter domain-containing protein n=1 Tax=Lottia gigantea TaxID=225164 RepID=V4AQU5_LOTGI|nr:hypothetical protein LOTGIDRAFT_141832 [Lottia gigantea]ESO99617.1 hypothetical protein LOTGIDRAFT_141832 [Lottia gigantea]
MVEQKASCITIKNIQYSVNVKTKPCCGQTTEKSILKNINGIFRPGMNAILGPTGSGKSSALDVLAGRKDPAGLKGELLIDGGPPPDNFKCMVGYVVQDDVVMGTLTVRENFAFSASLRLPKTVTKQERDERIDQVIQELGLSECADTKVGNEFIRGVSGGERKRCNIGMELIISPPVLFLDEPTTGLDASTANAVMLLLKRYSLKGRTIIFSIHQPRFSIYRLFDSLMLLSSGEVVYHGPSADALDYFKSIGYECEEHNNPPDFFLDIINGDSSATLFQPILKTQENIKKRLAIEPSPHKDPPIEYGGIKTLDDINDIKQINPIHQQYKRNVENDAVVKQPAISYATSFAWQLLVVSLRTGRNLFRNPQSSILQIFVMIIFAVIVGAVYWQIDDSSTSGVQNRVGAFFFIIMNQVFGNLSAIELFIKERSIFIHENVSGFYRVSAYFLAKVFCDVIPMRLIPVIVFSSIVYWMVGKSPAYMLFFFFMLDLFLTTLSASSLAFAISASVRMMAIANLLIALCFVFMMLFSGLLVNLNSMADWLSWLKWGSIFKYSLDALSINELKDKQFCDMNNGTSTCISGNDYLTQQGIEFDSTWLLWRSQVALFAISVIFLFLGYLKLLFLYKLR